MPRYRSPYDSNPLPDPGDGSPDAGDPPEVAPSKSLRVNWSSPQPLQTVTLKLGDDGSGGGGGGPDGGTSTTDQPNQSTPDGATPGNPDRQRLLANGPEWESVRVRPEDLLAHEQVVLDQAKALAEMFNALVVDSEAKLGAAFWGTEEGTNQIQRAMPGTGGNPAMMDRQAGFINRPHYIYTSSALSTQEFLAALRMNQRAALQHAADAIAMSGGFIELLNATADAYAVTDQYSVFPDRSSISGGQG